MKGNIIKYLFILFVIFIIIFAIYKMNFESKQDDEDSKNNLEEAVLQESSNLNIGISNFDNINPIITQNRDVINLSTILYEPLLSITPDYKIELKLAKEWSKINENTYIIKLKDDLKWDDGSKISADDVTYTIEKLKEKKSVYSDNVSNIKSAEVVDSTTIKINLEKEEAFFEYNLIFPIISKDQFLGETDFFKSRIAPKSSGMYKVVSASTESMELEENNNWYKSEKRKISKIKIVFCNTMGDAYNSFKIGNIDMICTSNINIKEYIGTIGYLGKDYKGRELDYISLNCERNILSRKEVRQAINYAIDKNKIISSVYGNEYYVSSFPLDYGSYLYNKESTSSYNKSKAKKVLEDAGWKYKYESWYKTENYKTTTIYLDLIVDSSNKQRVKVAELIKKQLEDVGINVSLYNVSNSSYKNYLKNKNYDMIITGVYNGYSPSLEYFLGKDNISNYKNDEITNIFNDLKTINDETEIKEKYKRIIEIYEDEQPFICLYRNKLKVIYSMKLTGDFTPNNYTTYYNLEKWYKQ